MDHRSPSILSKLLHISGRLTNSLWVHALHLPDLNHPMIPPDIRENAMQEMENTLRPKGEALLEQCLSGLPTRVGKVKRIHQIGFPAMVILDTAKSVKPDLIMMGARGLGPIKELVLGSVSHRVLLHAPCSTLTVKKSLSRTPTPFDANRRKGRCRMPASLFVFSSLCDEATH